MDQPQKCDTEEKNARWGIWTYDAVFEMHKTLYIKCGLKVCKQIQCCGCSGKGEGRSGVWGWVRVCACRGGCKKD